MPRRGTIACAVRVRHRLWATLRSVRRCRFVPLEIRTNKWEKTLKRKHTEQATSSHTHYQSILTMVYPDAPALSTDWSQVRILPAEPNGNPVTRRGSFHCLEEPCPFPSQSATCFPTRRARQALRRSPTRWNSPATRNGGVTAATG